MSIPQVDVLICGGGPVGLLLTYQLSRMGISTHTVEQYDKTLQGPYGRACTLHPRILEMLDQLDLNDALSQIGFIAGRAATFKNGTRLYSGGFDFMSRVTDTFFKHNLNIRQNQSEEVFRGALESFGGSVNSNVRLTDFKTNDEEQSEYKITADLQQENGKTSRIQSKYIIGADGGHSTVRKISGTLFVGEKTALHWIRMDAVVKTNMPYERIGFTSIESPTHGSVLWLPLDHGRTRIGYALSPKLYEKYGDSMKEEDVKKEAIRALAPFELELVTVDWFTLYGIGRQLADTLRPEERVLLAGDAGHTHSSAVAQGMNTGLGDAVNLGWKLAGVLKGWFTDSVLETYSEERRPVAQQVLSLDQTLSTLVSGNVPDGYAGDPNRVLLEVLESSAQFTMGLAIRYESNTLNKESAISCIRSGWRAPDVLVYRPGLEIPTRLYSVTKNHGHFWILVFAGLPALTLPKLKALRAYIDDPQSFAHRLTYTFRFATIIAGPGQAPDEVLGVKRFGDAFYDKDQSAHVRYGIPSEEGGVLVVRPDGYAGFSAGLHEGEKVGNYLQEFVTAK
ncbi:hypothetical protein MMC28_010796 [Mycoblastus sanguinarius]|nr:hypothetical protein [Mycoblastus sanguinarius]